jgi:hypothetical protein
MQTFTGKGVKRKAAQENAAAAAVQHLEKCSLVGDRASASRSTGSDLMVVLQELLTQEVQN